MKQPIITNNDIECIASELELDFDFDRKKTLRHVAGIDVQACPGSGKTTLVASKLAMLSKKWAVKNRGACVITHTNVAKHEIIARLKKIKTGYKMLSYPHFLGTIQEFINEFLAMPRLRYEYNEFEIRYMEASPLYFPSKKAKMKGDTREYKLSYQVHRGKIKKEDYVFVGHDESSGKYIFHQNMVNFARNIEYIMDGSNARRTDIIEYLQFIKEKQIENGQLTYRDMYARAEALIQSNSNIKTILQHRFPLIVIDEMQDTEKYQDDLLQKIFPLNVKKICIVQRFGDPDQAIFDGMNDVPNTSYNKTDPDQRRASIPSTFRFDNGLAEKIKGLSAHQNIDLKSKLSLRTGLKHVIILYKKGKEKEVIKNFKEYLANQLSGITFGDGRIGRQLLKDKRLKVKIIGAVTGGVLGIDAYCPGFVKKSSISRYVPQSFCEAVRHVQGFRSGDVWGNFNILIESLIMFFRNIRKKNKNSVSYTKYRLIEEMRGEGKLQDFQKFLHKCLFANEIDAQTKWREHVKPMKDILQLTDDDMNNDYLKYCNDVSGYIPGVSQEEVEISLNDATKILLDIEYNTIHGVKGETHDVTLVLETQFHQRDISSVKEYLLNPNNSIFPPGKRKPKFMRRLYVGCSRPRHMLSVAIDEDSISGSDKIELAKLGWEIMSI